MPIYGNKKRKPEEKGNRRVVHRSYNASGNSTYAFARNNSVPEGVYEATLDRIEDSKTRKGTSAVDVFYTLRDGNKKYKIIQRVADGYYLDVFCEQLADAGVRDGVYLDELESISVTLEVGYESNGCANIAVKPSKHMAMALLEDEDDDLLEEDD